VFAVSSLTLNFCRYVSAWKEFAENVVKTPEPSGALERNAMAEVRNGAAMMVPNLVWVARKS